MHEDEIPRTRQSVLVLARLDERARLQLQVAWIGGLHGADTDHEQRVLRLAHGDTL